MVLRDSERGTFGVPPNIVAISVQNPEMDIVFVDRSLSLSARAEQLWGRRTIMQTLFIATRNRHKTQEIRQILDPRWDVRDLSEVPAGPVVEETGGSFEENAQLKAIAISRTVTGLVLADDSGLIVDALEGAPGVQSARFAGPEASDNANRSKLIGLLRRFPIGTGFPARFRCVMVIASEGEFLRSFCGVVDGEVIPEERGDRGFGYDPMFIPKGYQQTFGELSSEIKNSLSHRARALEKVAAYLSGMRQQRVRNDKGK
jgi:XTP/dITP diphosphohydrolase